MFLHADSEDCDQTGRMPSMIRVFAGCKGQRSFCWFCHEVAVHMIEGPFSHVTSELEYVSVTCLVIQELSQVILHVLKIC